LIVTYIYADNNTEWNCSYYNAIMPMRAFNRREEHESYAISLQDFSENNPATQNLIGRSDIIVVERNLFGDTLTMIQYWKVRNKNIVIVFDDGYDIIEPTNKSYDFWTKGELKRINPQTQEEDAEYMNPLPITQLRWGMQLGKAATLPSENLCKDWGKYTKTFHVRNSIELERYENITPLFPHSKKELWIGWCGSLSHLSSFTTSGILPAMVRVVNDLSNVKILIGGDKRIYDSIDVDVSKKSFTPHVSVPDFPKLLKSFDIPLAPLHSEYDMRRSWIKVIEYMILQIPWIATDCITYRDLKGFGKLIDNSEESWYNAIIDMVEHIDDAREFAKGKPYEFAKAQCIDNQLDGRVKIYEEIMAMDYPDRYMKNESI